MERDGRTPSVGCTMVGLGILAAIGIGVFTVDALTGEPARTAAPTTSSTTTVVTVPVTTTEPPPERHVDEAALVVDEPVDHRIVYVVETFSGDVTLLDTETRTAWTPFQAVVATSRGGPDENGPMEERDVYVLGGVETGRPDQERSLLTVAPSAPVRTGRFNGDLAAARDAGLVEFTGTRLEISSLTCDVYRTRSPLDVSRLEAPTERDHAELCIDPQGLVLRETWTVEGALFRRRTAIEVAVGQRVFDPADFEAAGLDGAGLDDPAILMAPSGTRIADASGGGRLRRLTDDSTAPGALHLLPSVVPAGFSFDARYVFVGDRPQGGATEIQVERIVSLVDVYRRGGHFLAVENGGSTTGPVSAGDVGVPVDVDGHPGARAVLLTNQTEVFLPTTDGRFARVTSTLPLAEVVAVARSLVDTPGTGEVTPYDDEIDVTGRAAPEDTGSGDTGSGDTGSGDTGSGDTGSGDTGSDDTGSGVTGSGVTGSGVTGEPAPGESHDHDGTVEPHTHD